MTAVFSFSYSPCSPVLDYDTANITMFSADAEDECGPGTGVVIYREVVPVIDNDQGTAAVLYQSPEVKVISLLTRTRKTAS